MKGSEARSFVMGSWVSWGLVGVLALTGCGYRFVGGRADDAPRLSVALHALGNATFEPDVEWTFTEALRRELQRVGRMELVEDGAAADFVLRGEVASVRTESRSFSQGVRALEFTVAVSLRLEVRRADGSVARLPEHALSERELYLASADLQVSRKNREEALRAIAAQLAQRIRIALLDLAGAS